MLICDFPVELLSQICSYLAVDEAAGLFGTLNHRLQDRLSQPNVMTYLRYAVSSTGLTRYFLSSITRADVVEFERGLEDIRLVRKGHPYRLKLAWNPFPNLFDVYLPNDLESLSWIINDATSCPKIQIDWDYEDELRRRFEDTESDSDDENEEDAEPSESSTSSDSSANEKDEDNVDDPSLGVSEPSSRPSETEEAEEEIEERVTVASASRADFWPPSLTELDLAVPIHLLRIWTELVLNIPSTVISLQLRPMGTWSPYNYGEDADFFIEDAWAAAPSLTSLSLIHPELRSRFAETDAVKHVLEDPDLEAVNGDLVKVPFEGTRPMSLDYLNLKTYTRRATSFIVTNIMPSLRTLKLKLEDNMIAQIPLRTAKHFVPPYVTSLIFPGCIDFCVADAAGAPWTECVPPSVTELELRRIESTQCYLLVRPELPLRKLSFVRMYHSYQELEASNVLSLRNFPTGLTDLDLPMCNLFPSYAEDRLSLLPATLKRLCCKEESFYHIETILKRFDSTDFRFISTTPIPAFQVVFRPAEKHIDEQCNLAWLYNHISQDKPAWTELSTLRLLELLNRKFRGKASMSLEDSNLIYSGDVATQGSLLVEITSLDWRKAHMGGLSRPMVLHVDIMRLVPNLTNLNISLYAPRNSPTVMRIAGGSLPSRLTSLTITHEGPGYYSESLPALPTTLTSLRWYTFSTDALSVPRFPLPLEPQFLVLDTPGFIFEYTELFSCCRKSASLIRAVASSLDDNFDEAYASFETPPLLLYRP